MDKTNFSPNTHIFLWDLHGVILKKSLWSWLFSCLRFKRKREIIRNLNKKTIKILVLFILEGLKLTKKQMVSEELIKAAQTSNNDALIELIMLVCSSYSPIKKTVHIMQDLSQRGYIHHLGSNIGKTVYDDCFKKFPTIFNFFKETTIPFESDNATIIKKPHQDFFHSHIKKHNLEAHQIIFIDDKLTNVQAAQSIGMHGIHFKNARQLHKKLKNLHIIS